MRLLIIILLLAPLFLYAQSDTIKSAQSGNWSSSSTWVGGVIPDEAHMPIILSGHTVTLNTSAIIAGMTINAGGTLQYSTTVSATLQSTKSIIVAGTFWEHPASASFKEVLTFINVNEDNFQGGGLTVLPTDVGLWVTGSGKLDIIGTSKTSWTHATGTVSSGATSCTVQDATGWQVGDVIMIVPMGKPTQYPISWDEQTGTLADALLPQFEKRTITSITGNTPHWATPLSYTHAQVTSSITSSLGNSSRTWAPEVANLTRNVVIQGTKDSYANEGYEWQINHRAHIFINSSVPQTIKYLEGHLLGPRNLQSNTRPDLVQGRDALNLQHCLNGSRGTVIEGCSFWELGNRCFVPDESHGVTIKDCIAFDVLAEGIWSDFQHVSHDQLWKGNLLAAVRDAGDGKNPTGMVLGEGDFNEADSNVCIYCNSGDLHTTGGAYRWVKNSEGNWRFKGNMTHSSVTGIDVEHSTGFDHTIEDYDSFNNFEGVSNNSDSSAFTYTGGHHYKSPLFTAATGVTFERVYMDGGSDPFCGMIQDSPIPGSNLANNSYIQCAFRNYTVAGIEVRSQLLDANSSKTIKVVDFVSCDTSGATFLTDESTTYYAANKNLKTSYKVRVQPITGQAWQRFKTSNTTGAFSNSNISDFAPKYWGTGDGQFGDYYNGNAFNTFAFRRLDYRILFPFWTTDIKVTPTGVNYLITDNNNFSIRWDNFLEPQYTAAYTFFAKGGGRDKLWINNTLILDAAQSTVNTIATSSPVNLTAGVRVPMKVEHTATAGNRAPRIEWKSSAMEFARVIPRSQVYSNDSTVVIVIPCTTCDCE